jgi:predicted HicB family RNase H-like nuclease
VIPFPGRTVAEAERAFRESVDDDLTFCAARGGPPERPFSGKFVGRVEPDIHRVLSFTAERAGVSLNELLNRLLARGSDAALGRQPGRKRRSGAPGDPSRPDCPATPCPAATTPRCCIAAAL